MTRTSLVTILVLAALAYSGPTLALGAHVTMTAWKGASAQEKKALVTELLGRDGREGGAADVVRCLDAASGKFGHGDLPIGDVFAACAREQGEPT